MKSNLFKITLVTLFALCASSCRFYEKIYQKSFESYHHHSQKFSISSLNFKNGGTLSNESVFNGFGCSGKNFSPEISWKNPPHGTKSFALSVYDLDAPTGSGWWHWMLINIPANYSKLPLNFGKQNKFELKDKIVQVRNDFGIYGYGGPCPPKGNKPHRYIFTLHALKVKKIDLESTATAAFAGFLINQNTLEKSQIEGIYGRGE